MTTIGETVDHPLYGHGRIVATYRNGEEWLVAFGSGLRFRRPRAEFAGQAAAVAAPAPRVYESPMPMSHGRFEARQVVETLRVGIAPIAHLQPLTVGLEAEREAIGAALTQAHRDGGAVIAVRGEYGFGKSHLVEWTAQEALRRHFLASAASLDLLELPAHRAFDLYSAFVRGLRYPDSDERGLGPLLDAATPRLVEQYREVAPEEDDPFAVALDLYVSTSSNRLQKMLRHFLETGQRTPSLTKALPRGIRLPSLYRVGNNARHVGYLLGALSAWARLANYSGLALMLDEAESYSLLTPLQRPKATTTFKALIYAALGPAQRSIDEATLPQHRWRDYPATFGSGQSLFFLFTVTHGDENLPVEAWLDPTQALLLDPHPTPQEVGTFLQAVQSYHAQAFGYEPGERQGQLRRAAAEVLSQGMRSGALNIRALVRLTTELYDLLYLHPDYDIAFLLDDLRTLIR